MGWCTWERWDRSHLLSVCNIVSRVVVMVIYPTSSKFRFHENKFVFTTFEKSFLRK